MLKIILNFYFHPNYSYKLVYLVLLITFAKTLILNKKEFLSAKDLRVTLGANLVIFGQIKISGKVLLCGAGVCGYE